MGSAETERCAGVALFGKSQKADMATFQWAYKHLHLSKTYKLRIIHVSEVTKQNNANLPRERPDSRYGHDHGLEKKIMKKYPDFSNKDFVDLQANMQAHGVHEYICGVTYEGENFEAALQYAINEEKGLDTLVLAWSVADDTKGPPINTLESDRCSIVLAKVDPRKLTLSMPSTEGSAAAAPAAAPSSMAPALTNQHSNDETHSTSPNANTQCPDGRETGTATPAASATEPNKKGSKNKKSKNKTK